MSKNILEIFDCWEILRKFCYYVIFIAKILKQLELIPMKLTSAKKLYRKPLPLRRRLTPREFPPTILPTEKLKSRISAQKFYTS